MKKQFAAKPLTDEEIIAMYVHLSAEKKALFKAFLEDLIKSRDTSRRPDAPVH